MQKSSLRQILRRGPLCQHVFVLLCVLFLTTILSIMCLCSLESRLHLQLGMLRPERVSVWPLEDVLLLQGSEHKRSPKGLSTNCSEVK